MKTKITLLVLTFVLGLTNVFANSMPSSENMVENAIMTSDDGNSIIISAGNGIYTLDLTTNNATLLATSPFVNEINSIASDNTTGWIFYVSNHISSYNWTVYGYNVRSNVHKNFGSVRHFFTSTGHAYSSRGLASGGATFYNGKLYFAMEYPVYCYYYRGNNSGNANPKDELSDNVRSTGTASSSMFTTGQFTRNSSAAEADATDDGGRTGNGETPADFVVIEAEEANQINDNVSDYIPEDELPTSDATTSDDNLQQRGGSSQAETYSYNYYNSTYNNSMYLLEISFNGLSDSSGQTTSVSNGTPVYDNWWYSSFLYKGELGDIVVDDNGQLYAATSYQVQAFNFNSKRYDWANNEDVYAQMAKDKHSNLQLLKNKKYYTTYYYHGCPQNVYVTKSYVQSYTAPSQLRTYNNIQLGSLQEITGLASHHVGRITDASDYVRLTPPVSYKIKGFVYDDNDENGNFNSADGETKTPGITVTLYADANNDGALDSGDTVIDTKVTDANGWYSFTDVQVANTLVKVTKPADTNTTTYTATTPEVVAVTGSTDDVTVKFGINEEQILVNYDVFGTVYDDNNENASFDSDESGLANVTLTLYNDVNADGVLDANDTVIATTTSANDGTYSFLHVCVQNTIVAVTVPTDNGTNTYTLTTAGTQAIDEINNDVTGVDFGINEVQVINYSVSGNVYDDDDESGAQDAGEADLASVTVTLYADTNNDGALDSGDTQIASTTSATDGTYNFAGVTEENTIAVVTVPGNTADFTYTLTTAGTIDTSSVNTDVTGVNFGINEVEVIDYKISGLAFRDDNSNGVFDGDDDDDDDDDDDGRLPNVVVRLYEDVDANGSLESSDNLLMTTATGSSGTYAFNNVNKKNTIVKFTTPSNNQNSNYTATTPNEVALLNRNSNVTDVNFGVNEQQVIDYNISGTVFDDDNANAVQDAGEGVLSGVTVTLYADNNADGALDAGDTSLATATTDANGAYNFANIMEGNVLAVVSTPADTATFTYTLTTSDTQAASSATTDVNGLDFGINEAQIVDYTIEGIVFDDDNENATFENGSEGTLENITIVLFSDDNNNGRIDATDSVISSTTTAADGSYRFANVTVQATLVTVSVPADTSDFTYRLTTAREIVTSSTTTDVTGANFGINQEAATYTISGTVFDDDNENGVNDSENGLNNITISLYNDLNGNGRVDRGEPLIAQTASDRDGNYQFTGLTDVFVVVQASIPPRTPVNDYTPTTPISVGLSSGTNTTVDFGINRQLIILYSVSGLIWDDDNSNQIKDPSELVLSNITVKLYNDLNGNGVRDVTDVEIASVATTSSGTYTFTGIVVPNVIVEPVLPSNGTYTTPGSLAFSSINTNITNANFGINITANLFQVTGVVFDDDNRNGIADPGEGSIDGLDVEIYVDTDGSGTFDPNIDALVAFTQTTNDGLFDFTNPNYVVNDVPTGQVFIRIVIPAGNPPLLTYTPTYDPDTGTANPDGIYPTIMTGSISGVNFGIDVVDFLGTSRNNTVDTGMITNGENNGTAIEPVDVSSRLRLYPNPTVNTIAINADEFSGDVTVEIYNDRGYNVMTTTASPFAGELKVNVQRLRPGMYYVKFGSRNKIASKKFVKN